MTTRTRTEPAVAAVAAARLPSRLRRRTSLLAVSLAGLLFAAACGGEAGGTGGTGGAEPGAAPSPAVAGPAVATETQSAAGGAAVPAQLAFDAATTDGGTLAGASLAGQPVVFWFWAPWCTICRAEAPEIARMHDQFGDEVRFVGVAGLGQLGAMQDFVADTRLESFPHLVDDDGGLWSRFGVAAQPAFAFVTAAGDVDVELGRLSEPELADRLDALTIA